MYKARDKHGELKVSHQSGACNPSMRDSHGKQSQRMYWFPVDRKAGGKAGRNMLVNAKTNLPVNVTDQIKVTSKQELVYAFCVPFSAYTRQQAKEDFEKWRESEAARQANADELCIQHTTEEIRARRGEAQRVKRQKQRAAKRKSRNLQAQKDATTQAAKPAKDTPIQTTPAMFQAEEQALSALKTKLKDPFHASDSGTKENRTYRRW